MRRACLYTATCGLAALALAGCATSASQEPVPSAFVPEPSAELNSSSPASTATSAPAASETATTTAPSNSAPAAGKTATTTAPATSAPAQRGTPDEPDPDDTNSGVEADTGSDADPDEATSSSKRDDADPAGSTTKTLDDGADPEPADAVPDTAAGQDDTADEEGSAALGTTAPTTHRPRAAPMSVEEALDVAARLSPHIVMPSDCRPPPMSAPVSLPNAPRGYRSGTHQGIDFGCPARGHPVVAALSGRVAVAAGDFQDPSSPEWNQLLDTARAVGATPPYTLVMLYGNYVVVDHGIVEDAGHVVSLYAHLDSIDPSIRAGTRVEAGGPLGGIGNSGTRSGAAGLDYGQLHLHWELHIDGQYLGAGLSAADTRAVYTELFKDLV